MTLANYLKKNPQLLALDRESSRLKVSMSISLVQLVRPIVCNVAEVVCSIQMTKFMKFSVD